MKGKIRGATLVELVIFIAIVSIGVVGVTMVTSTLLNQSAIMEQLSQALSLTQGRMEIILGQRHFVGFTGLADPCALGSPPDICSMSLTGYTVSTSITPTTINTDSNYATVVVTVTGSANQKIQLKSLVSNY